MNSNGAAFKRNMKQIISWVRTHKIAQMTYILTWLVRRLKNQIDIGILYDCTRTAITSVQMMNIISHEIFCIQNVDSIPQ